jgi:hypothetical protein
VGKLMSRSRRERAGAIAKPVAIETASHAARILRRINTTALRARRASWETDLVEAVFGVSLRNQATNT